MISLLLPFIAQASAAQVAGRTKPDARAPSEIVAAAPAADWTAIAASDLLVMTLAPDAAGGVRRVVIQLMPAPFSQGWVRNIRKLAGAHWYDGVSVNRVQDNYVAQWGDATEKKALPTGLETMPESGYVTNVESAPASVVMAAVRLSARGMEGRMRREGASADKYPISFADQRDVYSEVAGLISGWPVSIASDAIAPVHCYGMVGVGRDLSPNTGNGTELYTVIGHAPRHLDRNIALVGRVIEGIEHLSSLPRGTEGLGFYKTAGERTPVVSIRLATELPTAERPRFEYLSTESATFARYADARANRRDAFFIRPAGGADVCNVPVPVRRVR
jgi:cyclophilin family peptidyl-prolyl cis-trans isomerase